MRSKQGAKASVRTSEPLIRREPVNLLKRIGSTTYLVSVHFSGTSKETMSDKILRLIEREATGL